MSAFAASFALSVKLLFCRSTTILFNRFATSKGFDYVSEPPTFA